MAVAPRKGYRPASAGTRGPKPTPLARNHLEGITALLPESSFANTLGAPACNATVTPPHPVWPPGPGKSAAFSGTEGGPGRSLLRHQGAERSRTLQSGRPPGVGDGDL